MVSINKSTGAGSVIGSTGTQVSDLSFDTLGTLYGWTASESGVNGLITIDLGTAAITFVEPPSLQTSRTGLAFDSGDDLYLKDWNQLFAVDPLTAQLASVGSVAGASNLHNVLEFGESGTLFTVSRQGFAIPPLHIGHGRRFGNTGRRYRYRDHFSTRLRRVDCRRHRTRSGCLSWARLSGIGVAAPTAPIALRRGSRVVAADHPLRHLRRGHDVAELLDKGFQRRKMFIVRQRRATIRHHDRFKIQHHRIARG